MSCTLTTIDRVPSPPLPPRKRTSSFSFSSPASSSHGTTARPQKAPRTGMGPSLRRTSSYLSLPTVLNDTYTSPGPSDSPMPYHRTLRYYKEQRERRKAGFGKQSEVITMRTQSLTDIRVHLPKPPSVPPPSPGGTALRCLTTPPPSSLSSTQVSYQQRATSPLAPFRTPLPPRTHFPRSKPEPDLYRKAITTRMRYSPEGQKILGMGARLAVSILTATRELERIVAQQSGMDVDREDVMMVDGGGSGSGSVAPLANSWVLVPGEDWEMVDCSA